MFVIMLTREKVSLIAGTPYMLYQCAILGKLTPDKVTLPKSLKIKSMPFSLIE